jgi:hypothetical protein
MGLLEAPGLGNEDGVMPKELASGKPTMRRYEQAWDSRRAVLGGDLVIGVVG